MPGRPIVAPGATLVRMDAGDLSNEPFCYVTTTGRRSGRPHRIEIWFGWAGGTIYLLAGGGRRSDWVRNLLAAPVVPVRIGDRAFTGHGRLVADAEEDRRARDLVFGKYAPGYGGDLTSWRDRALPVAIDLDAEPGRT